ncbi:hypothetical protein QAD02_006699 [Eretmocerus hayati]|uniref:Uncharacterized protein n=1 Tax=Eretmocerus hayati TaxID=131215 RepID=A0ACC2N3Y2_9HYME|nr:hypothetical protein QAD02_006699 [Eretmocerus hayati]
MNSSQTDEESTEKKFAVGFIFTKSHVDEKGRVHWTYKKSEKKNNSEKRRSISDSIDPSDGKEIVEKGSKRRKLEQQSSYEESNGDETQKKNNSNLKRKAFKSKKISTNLDGSTLHNKPQINPEQMKAITKQPYNQSELCPAVYNLQGERQTTGKLIGSRLCISGYIYIRKKKHLQTKMYWECTRYSKSNPSDRCRARAITLFSSDDNTLVIKGPMECGHNHPPCQVEIERAIAAANMVQSPSQKQMDHLQSLPVNTNLQNNPSRDESFSKPTKKIITLDESDKEEDDEGQLVIDLGPEVDNFQQAKVRNQAQSDPERDGISLHQSNILTETKHNSDSDQSWIEAPICQTDTQYVSLLGPQQEIGQFIGGRLCINGYMYMRNHRERVITYWQCTRNKKKIGPNRCRARAMTILSSDGHPIILRGPTESEHNHLPNQAAIDRAMKAAIVLQSQSQKETPGHLSESVKNILSRTLAQRRLSSNQSEEISTTFSESYSQGEVLSNSEQEMEESTIEDEPFFESIPVMAILEQPPTEDQPLTNFGLEVSSLQKPGTKDNTLFNSEDTTMSVESSPNQIKLFSGSNQATNTVHERITDDRFFNDLEQEINKIQPCKIRTNSFLTSRSMEADFHEFTVQNESMSDPLRSIGENSENFTPGTNMDAEENIGSLIENCLRANELGPTKNMLVGQNDTDSTIQEIRDCQSEDHMTSKDSKCTPSGTINKSTMIVKQIGKRLYVDGYIYVRKVRPSQGVTDWACRRCAKKNIVQKCQAKAQTIASSSAEIIFKNGGPELSKHNHPPMNEDVEDARKLVKPGYHDFFTYQSVWIENSSDGVRCKKSNRPQLPDQHSHKKHSKVKGLHLDTESLSYRRFLIALSKNPILDEKNIMSALATSYNLSEYNKTAYAKVIQNREKIMKDVKYLKNDPRTCKTPTQNGNYSPYEAGDSSQEKFYNQNKTQRAIDDHCNYSGPTEQENVITSTQGDKNPDGVPVRVSLPIKDLVTYWPPIPDPDDPLDDDGADPLHCVYVKEKYGLEEEFDKGKEFDDVVKSG